LSELSCSDPTLPAQVSGKVIPVDLPAAANHEPVTKPGETERDVEHLLPPFSVDLNIVAPANSGQRAVTHAAKPQVRPPCLPFVTSPRVTGWLVFR